MCKWLKTKVSVSASLEEAVSVLHRSGMRIVLVVDENNKLQGTITDGDVRRALLKHVPMSASVFEVMNSSPIVASVSDDRESLLAMMKIQDLLHLPILNDVGVIIGMETLQHLMEKVKFDNPVFLMAGGFGKRLRPLTNETPKPLLQVGSKPILETILNQFVDAGFHNFFISTHYKAEMVRDHFGDGSEWDVSIRYVHEEEPLGTAGALGLLPKDLPKLPILMMNGDLLTKVDFVQLLDFHNEHDGDATMCVREYDFQVPYGVIKAKEQKVVNIVEKPVHKFFVNAGVYVLSPSILEGVDGSTYVDMPHILEEIIEDGGLVNMFPIHEYWLDIGQLEQFEQAQEDFRML